MLMTRILGSFIATTFQYEHRAYDETLYRASSSYVATSFSSPGCAAWLKSHESRIPGNVLANLKNAAQ